MKKNQSFNENPESYFEISKVICIYKHQFNPIKPKIVKPSFCLKKIPNSFSHTQSWNSSSSPKLARSRLEWRCWNSEWVCCCFAVVWKLGRDSSEQARRLATHSPHSCVSYATYSAYPTKLVSGCIHTYGVVVVVFVDARVGDDQAVKSLSTFYQEARN